MKLSNYVSCKFVVLYFITSEVIKAENGDLWVMVILIAVSS